MPILTQDYLVEPGSPFAGVRADRLVQQLTGGSRSFATGLFDHDCVHLNGQIEQNSGRLLSAGDQLRLRYEQGRRYSPRRRPEQQQNRGFRVVFEDADLIVVEKSAELLTVPTDAREPHTLISRLGEYVRRTSAVRSVHLVHRLDRGVSGLLVFGRTRECAEELQRQFAERKPERRYDALTAGAIAEDRGTFRSYLATGKNLGRYSVRDAAQGELAITHYQVATRIAEGPRSPAVTHVQVQLETGRRNQIRVQFAESGHPVLGDDRYRPDLWSRIPWQPKRLALHASSLGLEHPRTGAPLFFESALPEELSGFLRYVSAGVREGQRVRKSGPADSAGF
ncbi:MAG: Ribosomal large subunit pseudouridine synthase [Planctomycetota bacterium]